MSNTQFAFMQKSRIPDRSALQAAIDALGFDLQLDPELDLFSDSGYSPCVFLGESDAGFELFVEAASEVTDGDAALEAIAQGNDLCVSMVWRSRMQDCACAMIVSCALARDFGAVVSFEGEPPEPLATLLEHTRETIEDARR